MKRLAGKNAAVTDVSRPADLVSLFDQVSSKLGKVDVLFANASRGEILAHLSDAVIVNTTVFDINGTPGTGAYSAGKAAVRSLARVASAEWAGRGIRVNAVSPGPIATPIYGRLGMPKGAVDAMAQSILAGVPMKRLGQPETAANPRPE